MNVKEQIQALSAKISILPSETFIRLLLWMIKPALNHWFVEVGKHHAAARRYPEGSTMRRQAESHYNVAFANWHRLSMLSQKVEEVLAAKPYGAPKVETTAMQNAA